jgi:hypothetical protein
MSDTGAGCLPLDRPGYERDKQYSTRPVIVREPIRPPQAGEWWQARARGVHGRQCPRCGHPWTRGEWVHVDGGECAVIENCLVCGWEICHIQGKDGVPLNASIVSMKGE